MANVRVKLNSAGIREVLQSDETRADILRRAEAIKAAAGGGDDYEAGAEVVGNRVMGWVVTATDEAKRAEAEDRTLTRALDAGRD
jgi:hypothetical protein